LLIVLAGCGGTQSDRGSGASGPAQVRFAMTSRVAGFWPLYIAQRKGFFQKEGVNLKIITVGRSSVQSQVLLSGSVDVVSGTPDGMLLARSKGKDIVAVAAFRNAPVASLVVLKDIKKLGDLKGKRIAVSEPTGSDSFFVREMLRSAGLTERDYQLVTVGGTPNRAAALESGGVAAALLDQPQDFVLASKGFPRLATTMDHVRDYAWSWVTVRGAWAKQNKDSLVRFLCGLRMGSAWFYDPANRGEAISILSQELGVSTAAAGETYDLWVRVQELAPGMRPSAAGLEQLQRFMTSNNRFEGATPPSPSTFIDLTYLEEAEKCQ
jgi:ABC-type nitrate/sulfonate/bicarbonate transport system substrate-binding protein